MRVTGGQQPEEAHEELCKEQAADERVCDVGLFREQVGAGEKAVDEQAAEDPTGKTYATTENAADFIEIINVLLHLDGLSVELCGRWLWIGGNTKEHKEALKAAGCRWSSTKKLWSWHFAEEGQRWHKGTKTMAEIRSKYGSTTFARSTTSDALPA